MKNINIVSDGITFDDVLLVPKHSDIPSRSHCSIKVELSKGIKVNHPIIPANMLSIIGEKSLDVFYKNRCISFLHRFSSIEDQLKLYVELVKRYGKDIYNYIGFSLGVKEEDKDNLKLIMKTFPDIKLLCIDIAHADSKLGCRMTSFVSREYPNVFLVAGNVATINGAQNLWYCGADAVKVGIGSSGICSTRIITGNGVPQITAISDVWSSKKQIEGDLNKKLFVISDGGAKSIGDLCKALCFSDLVMSGSFFAGTFETPGEIIKLNGNDYKPYNGSSTHKNDRKEGVEGFVKCKGSIEKILNDIKEGLQSCLSYQNCKNIVELKDDPKFVRISNASQSESGIYGVRLI